MNVSELLAELEQQPAVDLVHKLIALAERFRQEAPTDEEGLDDLRAKIADLKLVNDRLEHTVDELRDLVARNAPPEPVDNTYTIEQFMHRLACRLGRTYGWRTDYAKATQQTPGCQIVKTDDIQRWQKEKQVPEWAYTQIDILQFQVRLGRSAPDWTPDEVQHLIDAYQANPHESNASLAEKCGILFGREITEQAIKGAVYRLGRQGRLPLTRPAR